MSKSNRNLKSAGVIAAIEQASRDNYLGDTAVIDQLLRNFLNDALQRRTLGNAVYMEDPKAATGADVKQAETLAGILLGRYSDYVPQPAWNFEGGIDEWLATELEYEERDPLRRVQMALLAFLTDQYRIVNYSQRPGIKEEEWAWEVDALIQHFTNLLLGIPNELKSW